MTMDYASWADLRADEPFFAKMHIRVFTGVAIWQPKYGYWFKSDSDLLGLVYRPLLSIDRRYFHKNSRIVHGKPLHPREKALWEFR